MFLHNRPLPYPEEENDADVSYLSDVDGLHNSYKFLRLFPLSQYDVPTKQPTLQFPSSKVTKSTGVSENTPNLPGSLVHGHSSISAKLTLDQIAKNNPSLDYTTPDLITLVISDSGILTPPGVAEVLLSIFGGE
jgi:translation initiation factor eIF-2B subunit alpha